VNESAWVRRARLPRMTIQLAVIFGTMLVGCEMIQTVEAVVDDTGRVWLLGEIHISGSRRALVTVLEEAASRPGEAALLAEASLAVDWLRAEEDAAWSHLQPGK